MASPSLVDRAHEFSENLGAILKLLPADDPLELVSRGKPAASVLFEMVVLVEMFNSIVGEGGTVEAVLRDGKVTLPRAPARKENFSYFRCNFQDTEYQIVVGVSIDDKHGGTQAPDIGLHKGESSDQHASFADVLAIWDAKLRGEVGQPDEKRIAKGEIALFQHMHDALAIGGPGGAEDVLDGWPPTFEVSGVISNGDAATNPVLFFLEKGFSYVAHFVSAQSACEPSRLEHLAHP